MTVVSFKPKKGLVVRRFSEKGVAEDVLHPAAVRRACPCASCVEEFTGKKLLKDEDVPEDITPVKIVPRGNYGVMIEWSDGHDSGIFTYDKLQGMLPAVGETA
jgi:DUF971 family protein